MLSSPTHTRLTVVANQEKKMAGRLRSQTIPHPMKSHPCKFKDVAFPVIVYLYVCDTFILSGGQGRVGLRLKVVSITALKSMVYTDFG